MHSGSMVSIQSSEAFLPDELVAEILSFLSVKYLMQFRCVNKSFNTLISHPYIIQMHLKKSARNPHFMVMLQSNSGFDFGLLTVPMSLLFKNTSNTIQYRYFRLKYNHRRRWVDVGSCNGLLCLLDRYYDEFTRDGTAFRQFCLWNPATRTKSQFVLASSHSYCEFSFGYDKLSGTYKVVAYHKDEDECGNPITEMKVFSTRDNYFINVQRFPAVVPINSCFGSRNNGGVYLNGTISWLVFHDYYEKIINCSKIITVEQHAILSLDLSTETYTQMLLPQGFDKVPHYMPTLVALMDCLCFCHDFQKTHFVIWQMKDFGVQKSWIQLYKVGYKNLFPTMEFPCRVLLPLYLSKNGDTLIWTNDEKTGAFIYSCKDNSVKRIGLTNDTFWLHAKDFVESLVLTR